MYRLFKHCFILTSVLFIFCPAQKIFAQVEGSGHLVSSELLKYANLRLVWENILPLDKGEKLEQMLIIGDQIYLISNRNFTMALDRQTGHKIFTRNIALEGLTALGFNLFDNEILYYVGNKYIELEAATGIEQKSTEVDVGIAAPVVRNKEFFYVSGIDDRLRACDANDRIAVFKVAADNGSLITTINAGEDYVVFGTEKGNIYSMLPDAPKELWKFDAAGGLVGQIIRDSNSLYFSTQDMNVYRLDVPDKYTYKFAWKRLMPGWIQKQPRVTANMVYQSAFSKNMSLSAIDKDSGNIVWTLPGGIDLLSESRGRAYVITEDESLVVMSNASGRKVYSVNFAGVSRQAYNTQDSKIYIGDKAGRVVCLEPLN